MRRRLAVIISISCCWASLASAGPARAEGGVVYDASDMDSVEYVLDGDFGVIAAPAEKEEAGAWAESGCAGERGGADCGDCAGACGCWGGCGRLERLCRWSDCEEFKLWGESDCGVAAGGWIQGGFYNYDTGMFNNYPNAFNMNQIWIYCEKTLDTQCGWNWGYRIDYVYSADGPDTQAFGNRLDTYGFGLSCAGTGIMTPSPSIPLGTATSDSGWT